MGSSLIQAWTSLHRQPEWALILRLQESAYWHQALAGLPALLAVLVWVNSWLDPLGLLLLLSASSFPKILLCSLSAALGRGHQARRQRKWAPALAASSRHPLQAA
jgi:hypothetical protein